MGYYKIYSITDIFSSKELEGGLDNLKITNKHIKKIQEIFNEEGTCYSTNLLLPYIFYKNGLHDIAKRIIIDGFISQFGKKHILLDFIECTLSFNENDYELSEKDNFLCWCFSKVLPEFARYQTNRRKTHFIDAVEDILHVYSKSQDLEKYINCIPDSIIGDLCNNFPCAFLFIHHREVQKNKQYLNKAIFQGVYFSRKTEKNMFKKMPKLSFNAELLTPKTAFNAITYLFPHPNYTPVGNFDVNTYLEKARLYVLSDHEKVRKLKQIIEKIKTPDEIYRLFEKIRKHPLEKSIHAILETNYSNEEKTKLISALARSYEYKENPLLVLGKDIVEANKNFGTQIPLMKEVLEKLERLYSTET